MSSLRAATVAAEADNDDAPHCRCLGIEAKKGTLRAGADADLVVLDRDPFATSTENGPEEIGAANVRSTWIDGEPVFEA